MRATLIPLCIAIMSSSALCEPSDQAQAHAPAVLADPSTTSTTRSFLKQYRAACGDTQRAVPVGCVPWSPSVQDWIDAADRLLATESASRDSFNLQLALGVLLADAGMYERHLELHREMLAEAEHPSTIAKVYRSLILGRSNLGAREFRSALPVSLELVQEMSEWCDELDRWERGRASSLLLEVCLSLDDLVTPISKDGGQWHQDEELRAGCKALADFSVAILDQLRPADFHAHVSLNFMEFAPSQFARWDQERLAEARLDAACLYAFAGDLTRATQQYKAAQATFPFRTNHDRTDDAVRLLKHADPRDHPGMTQLASELIKQQGDARSIAEVSRLASNRLDLKGDDTRRLLMQAWEAIQDELQHDQEPDLLCLQLTTASNLALHFNAIEDLDQAKQWSGRVYQLAQRLSSILSGVETNE